MMVLYLVFDFTYLCTYRLDGLSRLALSVYRLDGPSRPALWK